MIVCPCSQHNARNDAATIIPLRDDRLLLAWSEYTSDSMGDVAPARIGGIFSSDEGKTWGERVVLQEGHEEGSVYSAELLRMGNGDLGLFFMYANRVDGSVNDEGDVHVRFKRSSDEGTTWTDSIRISSEEEKSVLFHNDRALALSTGRLIAPVTVVRLRPGRPNYEGVFCYYSDDDGITWKAGGNEVATPGDPRGSCEPCVVELKDGSLFMFLRDASGVLHKCYSRDGAETWSTPVPTDLAGHNSPMVVKRIPDTGDLCVVWNQAGEEEVMTGLARVRITAAISKDEGETWPVRKNILSPLDDRASLDPPGKLFYKGPNDLGDRNAGNRRLAETGSADAPVYSHSSYPSILFFKGKAFVTHDAFGPYPEDSPTGLVLRILPISWFYE